MSEIASTIVALLVAIRAVAAKLDAHFISEVEHLVATAKANVEEI